jgi:hypothetical protein
MDTLSIYKQNNNHHDNKSVVLLSSWFLQTYNTTTNKNLFWILKENHHVYGIDNVWHWTEKSSKFTVANQEWLLLSLIKSIDSPIHIVSNSFPWVYTMQALQNLLSDTFTKWLLEDKLKSITLIAPATNSLWALDDYFSKCNLLINKLYQTSQWRKNIINFLLKNLKWVNWDIDDLYNRSKDSMRFLNNMKTILKVSHTIPTHIVFNTWDKAVLQQDRDSDREILEILKKVSEKENWNIWYTYTNENRHAVYLQDWFTSSSILEKDKSYTVWQSIKQFIDHNN